jgi:hypothetical protein
MQNSTRRIAKPPSRDCDPRSNKEVFPSVHPRSQQLGLPHPSPLQLRPKGSRSSYQAIHLVDCCLDVRYNNDRFVSCNACVRTIRSTSCCSGHDVCTVARDLRKQSFALCAILGTTRWNPVTALSRVTFLRSRKKILEFRFGFFKHRVAPLNARCSRSAKPLPNGGPHSCFATVQLGMGHHQTHLSLTPTQAL